MGTSHKVSAGQRRQMIAEAAYFRAEKRGFGGDPHEDWREAEAEVDARLREIENDHLLERIEEGLATAGETILALKQKAVEVGADAREEWQQDVVKLGKLRDALQNKLEEFREQGEHAGQTAKRQAQKIWEEISHLIQRAGPGPKSKAKRKAKTKAKTKTKTKATAKAKGKPRPRRTARTKVSPSRG